MNLTYNRLINRFYQTNVCLNDETIKKSKIFFIFILYIFFILLTYQILNMKIISKLPQFIKNTNQYFKEKHKLKYFTKITGNREIAKFILLYSKQNKIEPTLLTAVIKTESAFNPKAINKNNNGSFDRGLCTRRQSERAPKYKMGKPLHPGCCHLRRLVASCPRSWHRVVTKNATPGCRAHSALPTLCLVPSQ